MNSRLDEISTIARWANIGDITADALDRLVRYEVWLSTEAIKAGGIGPNEAERLWNRHILDSCLFAAFAANGESVIDVGSGVGLPGIPLAIIRADLEVTLLDKAQRRTDLALRAVRLLRLDNVVVANAPIDSYQGRHEVVVSRAAVSPEKLEKAAQRVGAHHIVAAASRIAPPELPAGWEVIEIPEHLLGEKAWMMQTWISTVDTG